MNNLSVRDQPFSFLAVKPKQSTPNGCNLAWITDRFYLADNNYFIYTCSNCQTKQIKKGKRPSKRGFYD